MKFSSTLILFIFFKATLLAQSFKLDTVLVMKGMKFHIHTKELNKESLLLIVERNSEITSTDTLENAIFYFKIFDFNKDNFPDIFFSYIGNNPTENLLLFDQTNNRFHQVENFDSYPDALPVTSSSGLYYSYHRAGCADLIWVSDLFKIQNFKTVHLGQIYGDACSTDPGEESFYIKIYKVISKDNDSLSLIQKLSHSVTSKYKDIKWGFIKHYWNKNFRKFMN
ncbi:MAG TPA: hypothetical protein VFU29_13890 [Chitinophagaceae bacterium]|nr:hypothetical protein [Chitinophagaceae bacterium]